MKITKAANKQEKRERKKEKQQQQQQQKTTHVKRVQWIIILSEIHSLKLNRESRWVRNSEEHNPETDPVQKLMHLLLCV